MGNKITVGGETKELTEEQFAKLQEMLAAEQKDIAAFEDFVGENIFVRTITMAYTGHVEWVRGNWMKLTDAAWVADTGRFSDFVKKGKPSGNEEIEPMGMTVINTATFLDISLLQMSLPTEQK